MMITFLALLSYLLIGFIGTSIYYKLTISEYSGRGQLNATEFIMTTLLWPICWLMWFFYLICLATEKYMDFLTDLKIKKG